MARWNYQGFFPPLYFADMRQYQSANKDFRGTASSVALAKLPS